jgi:hypothetical protein
MEKAALAQKAKIGGAQDVEQQVNRLEQLYRANFMQPDIVSRLTEYLPTPERRQFDAAANNMRPLMKPMVREPGEGPFTDADQALLDSLIPDGGRQDADNLERLRGIRAMIANARRKAGIQHTASAPARPAVRAPSSQRVIEYDAQGNRIK